PGTTYALSLQARSADGQLGLLAPAMKCRRASFATTRASATLLSSQSAGPACAAIGRHARTIAGKRRPGRSCFKDCMVAMVQCCGLLDKPELSCRTCSEVINCGERDDGTRGKQMRVANTACKLRRLEEVGPHNPMRAAIGAAVREPSLCGRQLEAFDDAPEFAIQPPRPSARRCRLCRVEMLEIGRAHV